MLNFDPPTKAGQI